MGLTGPHDYPNHTLTGGLVNLNRLLKKVAAASAAGLLAIGLVAGTASATSANGGSSGDVSKSIEYTVAGSSGDVSGK